MILDDVWPESESTIDQFKFNIPDYKIVVTSRTAFPKFKSKYNLKPLDHEDAMSLFCSSASFEDMSSNPFRGEIEKVLFQSGIYIYIYIYEICLILFELLPFGHGMHMTKDIII